MPVTNDVNLWVYPLLYFSLYNISWIDTSIQYALMIQIFVCVMSKHHVIVLTLSYVPLTNGMPVLEKETIHLLPCEMRDRRYLTLPKYTNNKE